MLHVVLYQPLIPPNTGNVGRQCVGMGARLHLVGPLGFKLNDRMLKRAGLDYWPELDWVKYDRPEAFVEWLESHGKDPWLVTKFGATRYDLAPYADGDVLIFGNEDQGLPKEWHDRWPDRRIFVPMLGKVRSYNLSNTVALVLGQAMGASGLYEGQSGGG